MPLELRIIRLGIIACGWLQKYLKLNPTFYFPVVSHFSRYMKVKTVKPSFSQG